MIETSHAGIAITQSSGEGLPVLMIHGNSSCKEVFRNQLEGDIGATYRCIAMDLPGHGASGDAADAERTYSMPGYAEAAIELMGALGHERYAMLGWSLGGHIGLEMLAQTDAISGLMITGAPPVGRGEEQLSAGFLPSEHMGLAGQKDFSEAEIDAYARATCGVNAPFEPFLREAVARTDGNARELMLGSFARGVGANQQKSAINAQIPLAIVNGADEPFVNNDFVSSLTYRNLWEEQVHLMEGIGHAPFWEAPDAFDTYLKRFLESL
ncbi:alpha/beta fold hydrolase [Hoeflea sp.]|uniref:alpha/beta fold hydrolase n=1 Tax=Hoeflea sp. TaxID=1940281 RepID=UPI003B02B225